MGCEYIDNCKLKNGTPAGEFLLREYKSTFCYHGNPNACEHRKVLIERDKLIKNLTDITAERDKLGELVICRQIMF